MKLPDDSVNISKLTPRQSKEAELNNAGYYIEGVIVMGHFDDPIWETCVLFHEWGHHIHGDCERTAWLHALQHVPIKVPFKYKRMIIAAMCSYG